MVQSKRMPISEEGYEMDRPDMADILKVEVEGVMWPDMGGGNRQEIEGEEVANCSQVMIQQR